MLLRVKNVIGKLLTLGSLSDEIVMSLILIWVEENIENKRTQTKELLKASTVTKKKIIAWWE